MNTVQKLTRYGRALGLRGVAGRGATYFWANGSLCTDLCTTNYAHARTALRREAALADEIEEAEQQYFEDLATECRRRAALAKADKEDGR